MPPPSSDLADPRRGWLLYACRTPYAIELIETIGRRGEETAVLVDNLANEPAPADLDALAQAADAPVVRPEELTSAQRGLPTAIPLITPGHRCSVEREARALGIGDFPPLLDPTAVIASSAEIGEGTVVNAAVVIAGASVLGRFVHVNRSASIGHHNSVADYATIGPGCVLAGRVRVGRGAFLGAGATFAPEVAIGANAVVGAGAVVIRDVPAGSTVAGNPARVLREDGGPYGGVAVPEDG